MNRDVVQPTPDDHTELAPAQAEAAQAPTAVVRVPPTARRSSKPNGNGAGQAPAAQQRDFIQEALRALRGRYPLAITLALIGAALGVAAVFHLEGPIYKSEGLIRIAYSKPVNMSETDQNAAMPMFDAYLIRQIQIMRSRSLLEKAVQTSVWADAGLPVGPQVIEQIDDDLTIDHPHNTDHLHVVFASRDPHVAAITVNAVIAAFAEDYKSRDTTEEQDRFAVLQKNKTDFQDQLNECMGKLAALSQTVGGADLETRYAAVQQRASILLSQMSELKLAVGIKAAATTEPAETDGVPNERLINRIALTDQFMQKLLDEREQHDQKISVLKSRFKAGDLHPDVVEERRQREEVQHRIELYAAKSDQLHGQIQQWMSKAGVGAGAPPEVQERAIAPLIEQTNQELASLTKGVAQTQELRKESAKLHEELDRINDRIRNLQMESSPGGRLSVVSKGEVPVRPETDSRKKHAIIAAGLGGAFPVAVLILIGLLGGKFRFVHETEPGVARTTPLLGMLPSLPDQIKDLRLAADAAHAVHHIRVMLQSGVTKGKGIYMVTSSTSGEGKTNLAVALGLSFAASGSKTLIIDCDLVGQGITRGFRAEGTSGLREAMDNGSARGFIKKLPQGLRLLTAGNADTLNGWTLSGTATSRMLTEVRRYYDVVLIDTGPILGSVEATVLAPLVDGVILAISRGQQKSLVDRAMSHLSALGAEPVGFVFNRARSADYHHSSYHSSMRHASTRGGSSSNNTDNLPESRVEDVSEVAAFGPLVRSVATFMRASSGGDAD